MSLMQNSEGAPGANAGESAAADAAPAPLEREQRGKAVTWRSLALCLVLLPINAYWVVQMEIVRYSAHPTTLSLFFNTVFLLLCLTLVNRQLRRCAPVLALEKGELLFVYSVLGLGSCMAGHDMLQVFVPMLTWSFRHATGSNGWSTLINSHLKPWLFISDESIYKSYYLGNDTLWRPRYLLAWLPVVSIWTLFFSVLLFVMLCINAILRKQWTEHERLTYPIVQLPLQIVSEEAFSTGGVFRNRLFWLGFALAGLVDMINSLNYYYPSIPSILTPGFGESFLDVGPFFTQKPWNAIGWTPLSFYPFIVGLGMFMPLDFLFSCVFFYWFWKLQHVIAVAAAWDQDSRFPYVENQAFGAYFSFCLYSVWMSRRYLKEVMKRASGRPSALDDSREPMRYRSAVIGIVLGTSALIGFAGLLGMSWWIGIIFFVMYFGLALAITRMRAELGAPFHDLHRTGPSLVLTRVAGSRAFDTPNLTALAIFFGFNRAYRPHPMPQQLEAFKLAEQSRSDFRKWTLGLTVMGAFAVFAGFWVILHLMYQYGAQAKSHMTFGAEPFDMLAGWLKTPQPARFPEFLAFFIGLGIAFLLQWLRVRLPWQPFHPLAFAVTSSFEINLVWGPLFLAWIFKSLILRYGGRNGFHRALPFFIGLMLGQFVVGSLWNLYGITRDLPTYQFWQ